MISAALFSGAASDYFAADQQAPSYTMLAGNSPRIPAHWGRPLHTRDGVPSCTRQAARPAGAVVDEAARGLTTRQAAEVLGVSPRTLEDWRLRGGGPVYRKVGRRLVPSTIPNKPQDFAMPCSTS